MKLIVDIYKQTGKWYTTIYINNDEEILLYDKEYNEFLRKHIHIPEGGYATVRDGEENKTFHQRLYHYGDL